MDKGYSSRMMWLFFLYNYVKSKYLVLHNPVSSSMCANGCVYLTNLSSIPLAVVLVVLRITMRLPSL